MPWQQESTNRRMTRIVPALDSCPFVLVLQEEDELGVTFYTCFKLLLQRALKDGTRDPAITVFLLAKYLPIVLMLLTLSSDCCWKPVECRIQVGMEMGVG